jgi:hypothetical protein
MAVHRFGESENAFGQKDLNATARELYFPHAVGLLGIDGEAVKTGTNLIERRLGCNAGGGKERAAEKQGRQKVGDTRRYTSRRGFAESPECAAI